MRDDRSNGTHAYLLYDATCAMCSNVAKTVRSLGIVDLSVRSLQDPGMRELLQRAGHDDLFEPALVETDLNRIAVRTGVRLRTRLARRVGLRNAARILKALVDSGATVAQPGRRGFLLRGAALGVATLVAPTVVLRKAAADDGASDEVGKQWYEEYETESRTEMSSAEADEAWQHAIQSPDAEALSLPTADAEFIGAVRHELDNGAVVVAVSWQLGERVAVHYQADRPIDGFESGIHVYEVDEEEETATLVASASNGHENEPVPEDADGRDDDSVDSCGPCPPKYRREVRECTNLNLTCAANCCAPCAFSCANVWTCIGCLAVWCPVCMSINNCCTNTTTKCNQCKW